MDLSHHHLEADADSGYILRVSGHQFETQFYAT